MCGKLITVCGTLELFGYSGPLNISNYLVHIKYGRAKLNIVVASELNKQEMTGDMLTVSTHTDR